MYDRIEEDIAEEIQSKGTLYPSSGRRTECH